jgi:3-hydroxyisobutyrate dehydrogenase-like beta-hydroxyacid dehydrogenase
MPITTSNQVQVERVGFVGLGDMGGPIARRIAAAGFPLTVWARRQASLDELASEPYEVASSLAELGKAQDVVGVCVFGDRDVREVVMSPDGILSTMGPASVLIIHSTVSAELCGEIAQAAQERGVHVVDAPVSGARAGAERGELTIMIGGDTEVARRIMPVLRAYGRIIRWMGDVGSGQITKVLNNVLCFANGELANVAIETGLALGLDTESLVDVLGSGSAGSFALDSLVQRLMTDEAYAAHASTMISKDTRLFQQICRQRDVVPTTLESLAVDRIGHILPRMTAPK